MRRRGWRLRLRLGSIWSPNAVLIDLTRELRASRVEDMVTILVAEQASAVATGATKIGARLERHRLDQRLGGAR